MSKTEGGFEMCSFTMRRLIPITAIIVAMPLLGAAHTNLDNATETILRGPVSKTVIANVHKKIAMNYRKDADEFRAEAKDFAALVELYRESTQGPSSGLAPGLFRALEQQYANMAQGAGDLAAMHEEMAQALLGQDRSNRGAPEPSAPCATVEFDD